MFASSDMASAPAGTIIGISLVPPLCTVGYALSIGEWPMAIGAALLFTAVARTLPGESVCVGVPAPPAVPTTKAPRKLAVLEDPSTALVRSIIDSTFTAAPGVTVTRGDRWSLVPTLGTCASSPSPLASTPSEPAPAPAP